MNSNFITFIHSNLYVFRDDLYPFLGGGNKGRKMLYIIQDIADKQCNAVVTTGGIQSNHCRALAIVACQNKWKCSLVLHGEKERFYIESGNAKIIRMSGAKIIFVDDASLISKAMDDEMVFYKDNGYNPYYVYGGGHTLRGGQAYIEAVKELKDFCDKDNWYPDYIFLASGTGSTQSGILAGIDKYKLRTKVIGISVARKKERAEVVVGEFYKKLCQEYNIEYLQNDVIVLDDYLCGGYEKFNPQIKELSNNSIREYGFTLDTTYTGKAFYGMLEYMKINEIRGNILFWHTGGIFNFLA